MQIIIMKEKFYSKMECTNSEENGNPSLGLLFSADSQERERLHFIPVTEWLVETRCLKDPPDPFCASGYR